MGSIERDRKKWIRRKGAGEERSKRNGLKNYTETEQRFKGHRGETRRESKRGKA